MAKGGNSSAQGKKTDAPPRIPIRGARALPLPAIPAALGMAAAYYSYPALNSLPHGQYILLTVMAVLVAAICFARVLRLQLNGNETGHFASIIKKAGILAAAAALGFFLGIAARRAVSGPAVFALPAASVNSISGILQEDPRALYGGSGFGTLELRECGSRGGVRAGAGGLIAVFFPEESIPRLKEFGRGCEIFIEGGLSQGRGGPLFNANSVHIIGPPPALESFRTGLRMTLLDAFKGRRGGALPVWGSFAQALLLGVRDDLDVDLSTGFTNSGCSHILALSGMHLAIISGVLAFLLRRPLGLRWAALAGAAFIVFYVFIAGSQPSLVRAAIMYLLGTFALWGFLETRPLSLLCMAFIIQGIFQSDAGVSLSFILSYLALAGILTLGESLRALFRGRLPDIINGGLSASLGAFIISSPVVALYFGSLRPIGIFAGLVLAPLSSLFMVMALAALVAAFLPLPIWNIFDFFLTVVYRLIESIVSIAGNIPGLQIPYPLAVLTGAVFFWAIILYFQRRDSTARKSIAAFD